MAEDKTEIYIDIFLIITEMLILVAIYQDPKYLMIY